jgi:hypothetical protein
VLAYNVGHVLSVRVLPEVAAGTDDDVDTINTGVCKTVSAYRLHTEDGTDQPTARDLSILHRAAHVGQDLSLQAELWIPSQCLARISPRNIN